MKNIFISAVFLFISNTAFSQQQRLSLTKDVLPLMLAGSSVSCTDVTGRRQLCLTQKGDQVSVIYGGGTGSNNGGAVEIVIEIAGEQWPTQMAVAIAGQDPKFVDFKNNLKKFLLQLGTVNGQYSYQLQGEGDYWTSTTDGIGWRLGAHYVMSYGYFTFEVLITSKKIVIRHFSVG